MSSASGTDAVTSEPQCPMLKTEHIPPTTGETFWRPERKAWAVLLGAFAVFCGLVTTMVYGGYQVIAAPRTRTVSIQVMQSNSVTLQRSGMMRSEMLEKNMDLGVGDRVSTVDGPAGVAASLRIGDAYVALWPLTTILVEQDDQNSPRLRLEGGQAVISLPRNGRSLYVTGASLTQQVELTAPGRYRIRELALDNPVTAIAEHVLPAGLEIAADQGAAHLGEALIPAGSRLLTGGTARLERTQWSLVRDGDFSSFTLDEYRATLHDSPTATKSNTWFVTRQGLAQGAKATSGLFFLSSECTQDRSETSACRNVVRLARLGGNDKDSTTGIVQEVAADVSAYRSVTLEADVRVDFQSLGKGGADGSECPLFAQVDYANAISPSQAQWFCFWAFAHNSGEISDLPYISSTEITPNAWHHFAVDLREIIPDIRVVHRLIFYSNGHDYDAGVADVSLVAEGLVDPLGP